MDKVCEKCGNVLNEGDKFCQKCGASVEGTSVNPEVVDNNPIQENSTKNENMGESKTNGLAIGAFVCSIAGLFIAGVIMGILAISFGMAAKNHMKIFGNEKGKGLATAGIVIGIIDVVTVLLFTILKVAVGV